MSFRKDSGNYKSMQEARKQRFKELGIKPRSSREYNQWRAKQRKAFPLW